MATSKKHPDVDAYLIPAKKWQAQLKKLRSIALDTPLEEEFKWGHPCYTFEKTNIVIIQVFKEYCALLFCKGALLKDPRKILIQQTQNVQAARQVRFTNVQEITKLAGVLKSYILEAIEAEKAGLKIKYKSTDQFEVVGEFQNALDKKPALKKAFAALTPGRQRGYLLYFSNAKQHPTRAARVKKCAPQILAGKGLDD